MCKRINEAVLADIAAKMDALTVEVSLEEISYEKQIQILKTIQTEFEEYLAIHCVKAKE